MAKLPPKKGEDNPNEWLNTYADMVTLLLTFFVLLFACSNLDETKLQFIFQAFKSHGKYVNQVVTQQDPYAEGEGGTTNNGEQPGGEGNMPQSYEELYSYLAEKLENMELSDQVSIEEGAAHITLRFDNSVLFDGNSSILKPEGREVLNGIIPGLHAMDSSIAKMIIVGHTAKAVGPLDDYMLSSQRACSVRLHLGYYNTLGEDKYGNEKYFVQGSGANDPIEDNSTEEGRAKNRRVEITIVKSDIDPTSEEVMKDILEHDFHIDLDDYDPNNQTDKDISKLPEGSAEKIIGFIDSKYNDSMTYVGSYGPNAVDGKEFIADVTEEQ